MESYPATRPLQTPISLPGCTANNSAIFDFVTTL
jgi:hypothetical protein